MSHVRRWTGGVLLAASVALGACDSGDPGPASLDDLSVVAAHDLGVEVSTESVLAIAEIDVDLQLDLENILSERVPDTSGRFVAAAAVVDVTTGAIVAYGVSSPDQFGNLLDRQRPSGSTLKLFVLVAAARADVHADDGVIAGRNCDFPDGVSTPAMESQPVMTIRQATAISSNCAFAKLTRALGPDRIGAATRDLGIERTLDTSTRFAIGANTVSMRELLGAAATITGGRGTVRPTMLGRAADAEQSVPVSERVGRILADMTAGVVTTGTAVGHELDSWSVVAKTGTAAASTDAWMFGGTEEFVAVVWMGNPVDPGDSMTGGAVEGRPTVHGGDLPADIWLDILTSAHRDQIGEPLHAPELERDPVVVVDPSLDCLGSEERIRQGPPGPDVAWVETGRPVTC